MANTLQYYHSKLTALRGALTETIEELEVELQKQDASSPRQRQNKKEGRVITADAYLNNLFIKKRNKQ